MKTTSSKAVTLLYDMLKDTPDLEKCHESIEAAFMIMCDCYKENGKLLVCGNGGSASDAEHIVGELMKGFLKKRQIPDKDEDCLLSMYDDGSYLAGCLQQALPAISLVSQTSLSTAYANDVAYEMVFAQQVYGYGRKGDVFLGLSTSGNAANVCNAARVAKAFGLKTIGMKGNKEGLLDSICDVVISVPSDKTYRIQELGAIVYHALCAALEEEFF